ncbi:hypothetical protein ABIB34_003673 [Rhodococcus sp. UYP5]
MHPLYRRDRLLSSPTGAYPQHDQSFPLLTFSLSALCAYRRSEVSGDPPCEVYRDRAMCEVVRSRGPPGQDEPLRTAFASVRFRVCHGCRLPSALKINDLKVGNNHEFYSPPPVLGRHLEDRAASTYDR